MTKVAILGGSGYTAVELLKILLRHPQAEVVAVTSRLAPVLSARPVRVRIREDIPPVPADVVQMDQVLTNLLENAARYSPPGTEISVNASRWQDAVEVRVADRGPGIAADERERVFGAFYRRDVDGRRGGTGLGLAIAQAVVAAHGGTIWVEDTPGGGATIGFRLPLRAGHGPGSHTVEAVPS